MDLPCIAKRKPAEIARLYNNDLLLNVSLICGLTDGASKSQLIGIGYLFFHQAITDDVVLKPYLCFMQHKSRSIDPQKQILIIFNAKIDHINLPHTSECVPKDLELMKLCELEPNGG